jgi:anhydro-N-acetylmuramic acid kinase
MLAALSGVPVIHDFRAADMALGGQGAPLIPYVDYQLFNPLARTETIGILNLGGIANVTIIPQGCHDLGALLAFDTGPANMVVDGLARTQLGLSFDRDGLIAGDGEVDAQLLDELLGHPFFARRPPKSTGREEFGAAFLAELIAGARQRELTVADMLATATALTARSVALSLTGLPATQRPTRLILGGGGARNTTLVAQLTRELPGVTIQTHEAAGWPGDSKEAIGFAILADAAVRGVPTGLPNVTGARAPLVLGALAPGRPPRVWPDWIGTG